MAKISLEPEELDHILGITADPAAMGQNQSIVRQQLPRQPAPAAPPSIAGMSIAAPGAMGQNQPIIRQQLPQQNVPPPSLTGMKIGAPAAPPRSITEPPLGSMNTSTPLERPTPADSRAAGALEFKRGMPGITAKPFTTDYYQQEQEKADYQKAHPWGSDISAHPGPLGKIGHVLGAIGNIAGDIAVPRAMENIPGTQLNRRIQEAGNKQGFEKAQVEQNQGTEAAADTARAKAEQENADTEKEKAENPPAKPTKEGNPEQQAYDAEIAAGKSPQEAYRSVLAEQQGAKKTEPASPFEAFAYGTPEERKAAQDFLALEKRTGAQYRTPSEIDERYSLYKRDPDAYKSMFGNRGDAQDQANSARAQAQAARMLKYFDARRKEIQNSFLMDDDEKQQQLSQIDQLEKPYQDAAQVKPRATDESDTIQVINPNGTAGTIPVSNIKKALSRGYKVAPNQ